MSDRFCFDVFLSHSSQDKDAVLEVAERLKADGLRVWLDDWEIRPGDHIVTKIRDGLEMSRMLVLFMSERGYASDWARSEVSSRLLSDPLNREGRFVPLRLDSSPVVKDLQAFSYISWLPAEREKEYPRLLTACRPVRRRKVVLLARPAEELLDECAGLKTYFEQHQEIQVLSAEDFDEGDDFKREFENALGQADLFVQLLGRLPGRKGYVAYQAEAAKRTGEIRVMQWRHPELIVAKVEDTSLRKLLESDTVYATGLEEFKRLVIEWARRPEPKAPSTVARSVFINADHGDRNIAGEIRDVCIDRNFAAILPMTEGSTSEKRADLIDNLKDCDVLIFIYGNTRPSWIRSQLSLYVREIRPNRKSDPRLLAVYLGPPPPKADPGIGVKGARVIDSVERWDLDRVRTLLSEIA